MKETILHNLATVQTRIDIACNKVNRNPADVRLLLATKTVDAALIAIAIGAGYPLIAENKVQELKAKDDLLAVVKHENHFIGHLQTNKIKDVLRHGVTCIQSVDRYDLALKLNQRLATMGNTIDILIQVNTSAEPSKFGIAPHLLLHLVQQIAMLPQLRIKGLMTIGLFSTDLDKVRTCYRLLRQLQNEVDALQIAGVQMTELSMGMSGDIEIAIAEGATIVRVGTAVFGARQYPDSYYWNENTY